MVNYGNVTEYLKSDTRLARTIFLLQQIVDVLKFAKRHRLTNYTLTITISDLDYKPGEFSPNSQENEGGT